MNNPEFDEYYNFASDEYVIPAEEFDGLIEYVEVLRKKLNELNSSVEENKKLLEENKKLKEIIERSTIKEVRSARDKALHENKKLKEKLLLKSEELTEVRRDNSALSEIVHKYIDKQ
tara:strand:+ start:690 stop:1040 length:351 start_codon:yes stop_codon:yes gene_type:complete